MAKTKAPRPSIGSLLSAIWEQHSRSYVPDALINEVRPKTVLPVIIIPSALLLVMYYVPRAREYTGLEHPWIPISLLLVAGTLSLVQWKMWDRQRVIHVLCVIDICLYCLAIVAVMVDTTSPVRYVWGLLYAQAATHYGNRYAFSWPLLFSIAIVPFGVTLAFAGDDFGLIALALFGGVMFMVNGTMTIHLRKTEREKERYRSAYEISDKVASESLDIALASSMAELGSFVHELRNVSTPILGNVMILKEHKDLHPDIEEAVESLERSQRRSAEIIDSMLGRIKRRASTEVKSFVLREVLDPETLCKGLAPGNRAHVEVRGEDLPFVVKGNPEHLRGALGNLLQNAFNAGAHRVEVAAAADGGLKKVVITVSDDGSGIAGASGDLFDPAARSERGASHGLGLPLSRRLVEVLGGTLRLAETGEEGSVFEVVLPGVVSVSEQGRERLAS